MSTEPTIFDCASLSAEVYADAQAIGPHLWRRIDRDSAPNKGFYAAAYVGTHCPRDVLIAVRGTLESQDVLDDAYMAPIVTGTRGEHVMRKILIRYLRGVRSPGGIEAIPGLTKWIFDRRGTRHATENWGNQIPAEQARAGAMFTKRIHDKCRAEGLRLRGIVGHSLGGALAQYLSENTGEGGSCGVAEPIPSVAFNAPYMGTIQGTRKGRGGGVLIVNCSLDPLSFLTQAVGNESHATAGTIEIDVPPFPPFDQPAPVLPNPVPPEEVGKFAKWFGAAACHYHSIVQLSRVLGTIREGSQRLSSYFRLAKV